jgi:hypothetical protein
MLWETQEYYKKKRERLVDLKLNARRIAVYVCMCVGQVKHDAVVWYKEHIKLHHPKRTYAGVLVNGLACRMQVSVCLLGSNLNVHATSKN